MIRKNRWWRSSWALVLSVLVLSLAACGQSPGAAVPRMTSTLETTPGATPVSAQAATASATISASPTSVPLDSKGFASPSFGTLWDRSDAAVASGKVSRSWLWGTPVPFGALKEPYAQAIGGSRLVQYFDKGRMEITHTNADPSSPWYVTSGLLTVELVTGQMQVGDNQFEHRQPAQIPVAGDLENISPQTPRFADYAGHQLARVADRTGQGVDTEFQRGRGDVQIKPPALVKDATYDSATGHNIPDVFTAYFSKDLAAMGQKWIFVMGHPISEPYWVTARINGKTQLILVQLFQRRTLTYSPQNSAGWQVEFGNIGLDYYRWRYHN